MRRAACTRSPASPATGLSARPRRAGRYEAAPASPIPLQQVEEREEKDPDEVHEVPVQPDHLGRDPPCGARLIARGAPREPYDETDGDGEMQRVHAGHQEIDPEEQRDAARMSARIIEPKARDQRISPLAVILECLDDEEKRAERDRAEKESHERAPVAVM